MGRTALLVSCAACGRVSHDVEAGVDASAPAAPAASGDSAPADAPDSLECPGWPAARHVTRAPWNTNAIGFDEGFLWVERRLPPGSSSSFAWELRVPVTGGSLEKVASRTAPPPAVYAPTQSVSDAKFIYSVVNSVPEYGVERAALDGSNPELFVIFPKRRTIHADVDAALLLDSERLYVTGPSGRLFRIDTRTRELTTLAECVGYDEGDFSPLIGMDATSVYFWAGPDEDERVASLMRVPR